MSIVELNQMFSAYMEEIIYSSVKLDNPNDRMALVQWLKKLCSLDDQVIENAELRAEYANYLRITLNNDGKICLTEPFKKPPPDGDLRPLYEVLANTVAKKYPPIPMTGPIESLMSEMSPDGKIFTKIDQSPNGGLYCYLAVSPDGFYENSE